MRQFVLMVLWFWVTGGVPAQAFGFGWFKSHPIHLEEYFEIPDGRYVRIPDSIDPDGDESHLMFGPEVPRQLRFHWKQKTPDSLQVLHQGLRSRRTQDLVLFLRSFPDGRLVDDLDEELPGTFFEQISPNLRSLSIFACFGEAVIEHYKLRQTMSQRLAYHPERSLFVSNQDCREEESGEPLGPPVRRFRSFMKQVERGVRAQENREWWEDEPTKEDPGHPLCALSVRSRSEEGAGRSFRFYLNGHFLGVLQAASDRVQYLDHPCSFLQENLNEVEIAGNPVSSIALEPVVPGFQIILVPESGKFRFKIPGLDRCAVPPKSCETC